jgi:hypothetical protein
MSQLQHPAHGTLLLATIALLIVGGCQDPHSPPTDNPNDPLSPAYTPKAPFNLHITLSGESSRTLAWEELSRTDLVYTVERRRGVTEAYVTLGTVAAPVTSFVDTTGIITDTTYYYRVTCRSVNGHTATGAPIAYAIPFPPPNALRMTCLSGTAILLEWVDNSSFESGYRVEESVNGGSFAAVGITPADTVAQRVTTLSAGFTYRFRVAAITPRNVSRYSNTVGIRSVTASFEQVDPVLWTGSPSPVNALAFSPDGRTIAAGSGFGIDLWWAGASAHSGSLRGLSTGGASQIVYSPDGTILASAKGSYAELWDPRTGTLLRNLSPDNSGYLATVSFDPSGSILACGTQGGIKLFDTRSGSLLRTVGTSNGIAQLSPDGTTIASASGVLTFYRASDGAVVDSVPGQTSIAALCYSPDGRSIAVSSWSDLKVRLWDAMTGELRQTFSERTHGSSVAFSPDGKWVAASDWYSAPSPGQETTGETMMWNVSDGSIAATFPGKLFTGAVAFSPYGNLIAVGTGEGIAVWAVKGTWVATP